YQATDPTKIYPLSLHDALPISLTRATDWPFAPALKTKIAIEAARIRLFIGGFVIIWRGSSRVDQSQWPCLQILYIQRRHVCVCRSEEHTSELQSLAYLVCRLLL